MISRLHDGGDLVGDSGGQGRYSISEVATAHDEIARLLALAYCRMTHGNKIPVARGRCLDQTNLAISPVQSVHGVVE